MAEIIAGIAAITFIGTTFVVLGYAALTRGREVSRMEFEPVVLEFKPRQRRSLNSVRR
ncbi:MAG: hypothetical protein KGI75_12885 [Rhizobiaceae bacterium]|nr:hypothetical protein [Rhizobiaceae bacterium]